MTERTLDRRLEKHWRRRNKKANRKAKLTEYQAFYMVRVGAMDSPAIEAAWKYHCWFRDMITREALRSLENQLTLSRRIFRDYDGGGRTIAVRIR